MSIYAVCSSYGSSSNVCGGSSFVAVSVTVIAILLFKLLLSTRFIITGTLLDDSFCLYTPNIINNSNKDYNL